MAQLLIKNGGKEVFKEAAAKTAGAVDSSGAAHSDFDEDGEEEGHLSEEQLMTDGMNLQKEMRKETNASKKEEGQSMQIQESQENKQLQDRSWSDADHYEYEEPDELEGLVMNDEDMAEIMGTSSAKKVTSGY